LDQRKGGGGGGTGGEEKYEEGLRFLDEGGDGGLGTSIKTKKDKRGGAKKKRDGGKHWTFVERAQGGLTGGERRKAREGEASKTCQLGTRFKKGRRAGPWVGKGKKKKKSK